jgi:membrane protease YdiL (CAAX protease family)
VAVVGQKLPQPGFWMAVLLVLLVLGIQIALSIPLTMANWVIEHGMHRAAPHLERQPILIGCINIVACGGAIALGLWLNRLSFRRVLPIWRISGQQVFGVAVSLTGAAVLLSEADNAFRSVLPPPRFLIDLMKEMFFSEETVVSRVWLLVIIAPITEELLFRGIILRGLLSRHRPATAVVVTAILFTVLHLNPWQSVSALFLGIVLGWFYVRSGSVAICIFGHATYNSMVVVFPVLPWSIPGMTTPPDLTKVEFQPWWLDLSGLAVLLVGLWIFRRSTPPEPRVITENTGNGSFGSPPS